MDSIINSLWNVLLLSVAIFIVANIMPTIKIKNYWTVLAAAVVYSVINLLVGWLLILLSLPFIFITFGLFTFVVNAFMLWLTDKLMDDFEIKGLFSTLIAAVLITLINIGLKRLL